MTGGCVKPLGRHGVVGRPPGAPRDYNPGSIFGLSSEFFSVGQMCFAYMQNCLASACTKTVFFVHAELG